VLSWPNAPELADGLQECQRLDVADGAADLDDVEVEAVAGGSRIWFDDFVGDVRNNLDGFAEVLAGALVGHDVGVNAAVHERTGAGEFLVEEALVMAEVEVGFGAVFGDEDFAVLSRVHGAGVGIKVGVAFLDVN
jgi:hypothetical protein